MSYQSTTPNFDLPQWVYTDPPQMNDFNTAFSNIDSNAVPNTRTVNGKALSSNITLTAANVSAVPTSRTVNGKALSSNITLSASDVGAVTQTVYELTPQNGWTVASAASACHLIVTGRLATLVARLKAPSTTINDSNNRIFTLPSGVVPTKYIDCVMSYAGDISNAAGVQIGSNVVMMFAGTLTVTGPYSINASFLIN